MAVRGLRCRVLAMIVCRGTLCSPRWPGAPERVPSPKLDYRPWSALRGKTTQSLIVSSNGAKAQRPDLRERSTLRLGTRSGALGRIGLLVAYGAEVMMAKNVQERRARRRSK
jgi:hypothetical protein